MEKEREGPAQPQLLGLQDHEATFSQSFAVTTFTWEAHHHPHSR